MEREKKVRRINGWRTLAIALLVLIFLGAAVGVGSWLWWREEGHQALRDTRNAWTAIRLTQLEYYGDGVSIYDNTRASGLKEKAEEQVRDYVGYKGDLMVLSYKDEESLPTAMIYRKGAVTVYYYVKEDGTRHFDVYRGVKLLDVDSAAIENFG